MQLEEIKKDLKDISGILMIPFNDDKQEVSKYLLGVYNTIVNNPKLLSCSSKSIIDAVVTSATLGVAIDARKLAYLIPYNNNAQFQLSYKGYVSIAKRDPEVDNIQSILVYKCDEFSFDYGANLITHKPDFAHNDYGKTEAIQFVYAIVRFRQGTGRATIFEILTKEQIDTIRDASVNGGVVDKWDNPTIWEKHYGEMARKTIIKRLCKHAQLGDTADFDGFDVAIENNKIVNVTPDKELVVKSAVTKLLTKQQQDIIEAKYDLLPDNRQQDFTKTYGKIDTILGERFGGIVKNLNKELANDA